MEKIPVLDFSGIISPPNGDSDSEEVKKSWQNLAEQLYEALSQIGFIYIVNHGVDREKVIQAFEESEKFFRLAPEVKENFLIDMKKGYGGYTRPGQQLLNDGAFHEYRECFSIEHPNDVTVVQKEFEENPNMKLSLGFVRSLEELRKASEPVVRILLRLLAKSLDLEDDDYFVKCFNKGHLHQSSTLPGVSNSMVRTHFYPEIPSDIPIKHGAVRCGTHTDFGTLTFLFQDSMGGLEVKTLSGKWISAKPIPGSILVNTGDALDFWTGGVFPATAHRVLIPKEEIEQRQKRQSIAFFVNPDNETPLIPLKSKSGRIIETVEMSENSVERPIRTFQEHYEKRLTDSYKY